MTPKRVCKLLKVLVALLCVNELDASNCSMQEILTRLSGCLQHQLPDSAFPTVQNSESVISNLCDSAGCKLVYYNCSKEKLTRLNNIRNEMTPQYDCIDPPGLIYIINNCLCCLKHQTCLDKFINELIELNNKHPPSPINTFVHASRYTSALTNYINCTARFTSNRTCTTAQGKVYKNLNDVCFLCRDCTPNHGAICRLTHVLMPLIVAMLLLLFAL